MPETGGVSSAELVSPCISLSCQVRDKELDAVPRCPRCGQFGLCKSCGQTARTSAEVHCSANHAHCCAVTIHPLMPMTSPSALASAAAKQCNSGFWRTLRLLSCAKQECNHSSAALFCLVFVVFSRQAQVRTRCTQTHMLHTPPSVKTHGFHVTCFQKESQRQQYACREASADATAFSLSWQPKLRMGWSKNESVSKN